MERVLTARQQEIMRLVLRGDTDGDFFDIDRLREELSAPGTKQATQCSLRYLEKAGLIQRTKETRRQARRMVIKPTLKAYRELRSKPGV